MSSHGDEDHADADQGTTPLLPDSVTVRSRREGAGAYARARRRRRLGIFARPLLPAP